MEKTEERENNKISMDERLKKISREAKQIIYSTEVLENDYKIDFNEVKDEGSNREKCIFILKYNIRGIPQEVIIGIMEKGKGQLRIAKEIIDLIDAQLKENLSGKTEYSKYEQLKNYIGRNKIEFSFTMEGADIFFDEDRSIKTIKRTYSEKSHKFNKDSIECLYSDEDMKKMAMERKEKTQDLINEIEKNEKWKKRRELILKKLPTEEDKKLFLQGEKISGIFQETDESIVANRRYIIADYMLEQYENHFCRDFDMINQVNGYLGVKERGFNIDAKIILEKVQNSYYKKLQEKGDKINEKDLKNMEIIDKYKNFFELLKTGRDLNARLFALKWRRINFDVLNKFFEKYANEDTELLEYLKLKEETIKDAKDENETEEGAYEKHESVKKLYNFLLNSSVRKYTKEEDQKYILDTYSRIKRQIVEKNGQAVDKYNYYAEKNGLFVCPSNISNKYLKRKNTFELSKSDSIKKLYEIEQDDKDEDMIR